MVFMPPRILNRSMLEQAVNRDPNRRRPGCRLRVSRTGSRILASQDWCSVVGCSQLLLSFRVVGTSWTTNCRPGNVFRPGNPSRLKRGDVGDVNCHAAECIFSRHASRRAYKENRRLRRAVQSKPTTCGETPQLLAKRR